MMTENALEQLIRPLEVGDKCVLIEDDIVYKEGTRGYIIKVYTYNVDFKITGKPTIHLVPKCILKLLP